MQLRPPPARSSRTISGATHTTVSWRESIQAALAQALDSREPPSASSR